MIVWNKITLKMRYLPKYGVKTTSWNQYGMIESLIEQSNITKKNSHGKGRSNFSSLYEYI